MTEHHRDLSLPIVIEDQGGDSDGVEWIVSFNGVHPRQDECVTVKDAPAAYRLANLVERLVLAADRHFGDTERRRR